MQADYPSNLPFIIPITPDHDKLIGLGFRIIFRMIDKPVQADLHRAVTCNGI